MDDQLIGTISSAMTRASGLATTTIVLFFTGVLFFIAGFNSHHDELSSIYTDERSSKSWRITLAWGMMIAGTLIGVYSIINHTTSIQRHRDQDAEIVRAQRDHSLRIDWGSLTKTARDGRKGTNASDATAVTFYRIPEGAGGSPSKIILYATREVAKAIIEIIGSQNSLDRNIPSALREGITSEDEGRARSATDETSGRQSEKYVPHGLEKFSLVLRSHMSALIDNPHVNRKSADKLERLGISVTCRGDEKEILAALPVGIYLDQSAEVFRLLSELGTNGYDQKSLHINTVEETIKVTFNLN